MRKPFIIAVAIGAAVLSNSTARGGHPQVGFQIHVGSYPSYASVYRAWGVPYFGPSWGFYPPGVVRSYPIPRYYLRPVYPVPVYPVPIYRGFGPSYFHPGPRHVPYHHHRRW